MFSGVPGTAIIEQMAELGEKVNHGNLNTHKLHVVPPEQTNELDRLKAELEFEARANPATVAVLYKMLARGIDGLKTGKPPTVAEMNKIVATISQVTGLNTKTQLMLAFAQRAFAPGGALADQRERVEVQQLPPPLLDDEPEGT